MRHLEEVFVIQLMLNKLEDDKFASPVSNNHWKNQTPHPQ
jgi:hypothetical protein